MQQYACTGAQRRELWYREGSGGHGTGWMDTPHSNIKHQTTVNEQIQGSVQVIIPVACFTVGVGQYQIFKLVEDLDNTYTQGQDRYPQSNYRGVKSPG